MIILIDNMRTNVNRKTHQSTRIMVYRNKSRTHVFGVVDDGATKIFGRVPDCGAIMTENAKHTLFA